MKKYKWLKAVAFILALIIPLMYVAECFSFPPSYVTRTIESFYSEKKNTVDGIVIGTSVIGMGWSAPVGWYEYGMTVCNLGTTVQPFGTIDDIIEFVKKTQDLKYVVIDLHALRISAIKSSVLDKNLRRLYLSMHLGPERYKMLNASLDYAQKVYDYYGYPENENDIMTRNKFRLYVPFYDFHNRWKEGLKKSDFTAVENPYKGAYDTKEAFYVFDGTSLLYTWDEADRELDSFQKEELDRLLSYLDETDMDALFINYPSLRSVDDESQVKAAIEYVREKGFNAIDFADKELLDEIGFDITKDFKDKGHVNSKGACKVTKYVCSYLKENYEYEDHREQSGYESWDKSMNDYDAFLRTTWMKNTGEEYSFNM